MTGWEYRVIGIPIQGVSTQASVLNNAGKSGWELVSVVYDGVTRSIQLYFKRSIPWALGSQVTSPAGGVDA